MKMIFRMVSVLMMIYIFFSICFLLAQFGSILFGFNYGSGNSRFGNFISGVEVPATLSVQLADSSFYADQRNKQLPVSLTMDQQNNLQPQFAGTSYSHVIRTNAQLFKGAEVSDHSFEKISNTYTNVHLQPSGKWQHFLLALPNILLMLVTAFCTWQMYLFLNQVVNGQSFADNIQKRLLYTGSAIAGLNIYFLFHFYIYKPFDILLFSFSSGVSPVSAPYTFSAHPDDRFSLPWLGIGLGLILMARAFSYGQELLRKGKGVV